MKKKILMQMGFMLLICLANYSCGHKFEKEPEPQKGSFIISIGCQTSSGNSGYSYYVVGNVTADLLNSETDALMETHATQCGNTIDFGQNVYGKYKIHLHANQRMRENATGISIEAGTVENSWDITLDSAVKRITVSLPH